MMRERGSGSLRLRNGIYQMRYWHNGKKIEESTKTGDVKKAHRILQARTKKANTPDFIAPDSARVSFKTISALYLASYRENGRRSLPDAERHVRQLCEEFGLCRALEITTERIEAYKTGLLAAGRPKATVNRRLQALRRMFRLAVRKRMLHPTAAPFIELLDESDNARQGFIEPADFDAFCGHLPEPIADVALFAYLSLWRRENVLGLMWPHLTLSWRDGQIVGGVIRLPHVLTKNKKPLTLVLAGRRLLELIRRRWAARIEACPYVFHRAGKRLRDFRTTWAKAAAAVGHPGLLLHDLRRSGARNLRRAGKQEGTIMQLGGWRTRAMFLRYDITDESDLAAAADAYDAFLDTATNARKVISIGEAPRARTGSE